MIPIDWKPTKFRYEISIRNGDFISDKLDENGLHPVVGGNGFMGMTNDFNVDEEVIAIGRVGAYFGNVYLVTKQSWISDNALIVTSMHDLKYLVYVFIALNLNSEANKTAQPVITGTKIKNIRIAIPTREDQSKIAYFLDGKLSESQHIKENIQQQISTLEQYRKSLIHECVTGKRRITNDNVQN
jgi:type I restriction enzyme S subunit